MTKISTGSYDLNKWLYGGYEKDVISVLYGSSGSGKTNFCLLAAVSQAKKRNKVIYIDTEGGFSVDRVKQLAGEENELALQNIFLLSPTNFDEQKHAFEQLLKHLKEGISLIVVDGMTILYRLDFASARDEDHLRVSQHPASRFASEDHLRVRQEFNIPERLEDQRSFQSQHVKDKVLEHAQESESQDSRRPASRFASEDHLRVSQHPASRFAKDQSAMQKVNAELVRQLRTLAEIARKQHIPVLITNQTYHWEQESRMVAGDILRYWGKCHIELIHEGGRRTAHLRKHRSLPESSLPFQIVHEGIKKRGWI